MKYYELQGKVCVLNIYLPTDLIRLNSSILPPRLLGSRVPRSRSGFELDLCIEALPAKRTPKLRSDFHDIMKIQGKRQKESQQSRERYCFG